MARTRRAAGKIGRIKMLLLDVDGVLTDGTIMYTRDGAEMKRFSAHDGYGAVRAREHGLILGIVSGRTTPIVDVRARDLQIADVIQGATDKVAAMEELRERYGLERSEVAFMGDDVFDLPLLRVVGFSLAPRNAQREVKKVVDRVTRAAGGAGAVREAIDLIISHRR